MEYKLTLRTAGAVYFTFQCMRGEYMVTPEHSSGQADVIGIPSGILIKNLKLAKLNNVILYKSGMNH